VLLLHAEQQNGGALGAAEALKFGRQLGAHGASGSTRSCLGAAGKSAVTVRGFRTVQAIVEFTKIWKRKVGLRSGL
jgi:hypothetical protein